MDLNKVEYVTERIAALGGCIAITGFGWSILMLVYGNSTEEGFYTILVGGVVFAVFAVLTEIITMIDRRINYGVN